MQTIFNLTNPHAANGQNYNDVYIGDGTTIYFDYSGAAIEAATINSVKLVWYGNVIGTGGTGTVSMGSGTMSLPFAYTGDNRQECAVIASGASLGCFDAASGMLSIALNLNSGYIRFQWARLEIDYTPNVSALTLSTATVDAGGSLTATVTAYDSSYTHTLGLYFGSEEKWWTLGAGVTSQIVTVPMEYLNQMTSTAVGAASLKLYTLSGSTVLGVSTQSLTITAGADSAPTFAASCTPSLTVDGVTYPDVSQGGYVRTKCGAQAKIEGVTGQYGASITSTQISVLTYTAQGMGDLTLNSGLLNQSGNVDVVLSATDSRGLTTAKTITLNVLPYDAPKLTSLSVSRCDAAGTADAMGDYGSYALAWTYSDLGGKNVPTASLSVRKKGTEDTPTTMASDATSGSNGVLSDASGAYALDQAYPWEVILTITDGYGSVSFTGGIASAQFVRTVNRRLNAVAYGKTAEHEDSFEIAPTLEMYVHGKTLPDYVNERIPVQSVNGETGAVVLDIPAAPVVSTKSYAASAFLCDANASVTLTSYTPETSGTYVICYNVWLATTITSRTFLTFNGRRASFPANAPYPDITLCYIGEMTAGTAYPLTFWTDTAGTYNYETVILQAIKIK